MDINNDDFEEAAIFLRSKKSREKASRRPQRVLKLDEGDQTGGACSPEPPRPAILPPPARKCEPSTPKPSTFRITQRDTPPDMSRLQIGGEGSRKAQEDLETVLGQDGMRKEQPRAESVRDNSASGSRRATNGGELPNEKKRELLCEKESESEKKRKVDSRFQDTEPSHQGDAVVAEEVVSDTEVSSEFPEEEEALSERERLRLQREEQVLRFEQAAETEILEDIPRAPTPIPRTGLAILLLDCGLMRNETSACTSWTAEEILQKVSAFQRREIFDDALLQSKGKFNRARRQVNNSVL